MLSMNSMSWSMGTNYKYQAHPREYSSWNNMKQRCTNPRATGYENYGGIGISFEPRWKYFDLFLEDMGARPENHSLDRIDVTKDYSKQNCRWATKSQQQRNQRWHLNIDVGVRWDSHRNKWAAGIHVNNKRIAKRFVNKQDAINWRKEKETELWEN